MSVFETLLSLTATYRAKTPLGEASIHYFARAIGDDAEIYTDKAAAAAAGYEDIIAPPTFICETLQYSDRNPDENGYIGHSWDIPIEGWWRVRGGNRYRFYQPVFPSDVLRVEWTVQSVRETQDSGGKPIVVVIQVAAYFNQKQEKLAENFETIIYRRSDETADSKSRR
ncbi:MAG: MaoC family dehydratase N-terminal domain-containing protein [Pirellulales bacterium]|nr:MaoC family dehydratase N-terminal domain-containing protein [Pirellulales bacterium]